MSTLTFLSHIFKQYNIPSQQQTTYTMKFYALLLLGVTCVLGLPNNDISERLNTSLSRADQRASDRQARIINMFTIVRFQNNLCTSTSTVTPHGTCLTANECSTQSGSSLGSCAGGFGVCCVFVLNTCGATVTKNCTYVQNPNFPTAYTTVSDTCAFTVSKCSSDVCQYRLDFDTFSTQFTATTGECATAGDSFSVMTPAAIENPVICGTNTGQHMYLDAGAAGTTADSTLTFASGTQAGDRTWNVKVTQIPCNSLTLAPNGCTQYFTGLTGTVQSYNYAGGNTLQDQNYVNCIRQCTGYCSILWQESSAFATPTDKFQLLNIAGTLATSDMDFDCNLGSVTIPTASTSPAGGVLTMFCGTEFTGSTIAGTIAGQVFSNMVPFQLSFFSGTASQQGSDGFALDYRQVPC